MRQIEKMEAEGKALLTLDGDSLICEEGEKLPIIEKRVVARRAIVWFLGPCGMRWQGDVYGSGKARAHRCTGIRQLMDQLGPKGISIALKDDEYRVNYKHGKEATAYYTTDPVDAFKSAMRMLELRGAA